MYYPQRKQIRLKDYDYRQRGAYFCTVCVHRSHRHKELLARCDCGVLKQNRFGRIVENCWQDIPEHRNNVILDSFVAMPNHVHLVIMIETDEISPAQPAAFGPQPAGCLGHILGQWKSEVKRQIGALRGESTTVWQARFYDRVVRSETELTRIRRYIEDNPANWLNDRCHPQHPEFEMSWRGVSPDSDLKLDDI